MSRNIILSVAVVGLLLATLASGEVLTVCGFGNSESTHVRVTQVGNGWNTITVPWTTLSVTERVVDATTNKSCYEYWSSLSAGSSYRIDWKNAATASKTASEAISASHTNIDAAMSSRLAWASYSAPPTVSTIWSAALASWTTPGTAGYILNNYTQGNGNTAVNHSTGGADNLRYVTGAGAGISGATIKVFLKTDYDAGNRTDQYVKGRTVTDVNGRWYNDVYLDAGYTYTVEYRKPGAYGPDTKEFAI